MQSCLDLGNPAITKGHTFALCQACVSPRPVGTLSGVFPPPSLQELSESEAWVGISDRLRLHLLACAYARSFPCGSPPACLIAVSRASGIVPRPAARAAGGAAPEVVTLLYSFTHKHAPIVWTGDYTRLFSNHLNHPAWVRWSIHANKLLILPGYRCRERNSIIFISSQGVFRNETSPLCR